jgi:hypothetical protein
MLIFLNRRQSIATSYSILKISFSSAKTLWMILLIKKTVTNYAYIILFLRFRVNFGNRRVGVSKTKSRK